MSNRAGLASLVYERTSAGWTLLFLARLAALGRLAGLLGATALLGPTT